MYLVGTYLPLRRKVASGTRRFLVVSPRSLHKHYYYPLINGYSSHINHYPMFTQKQTRPQVIHKCQVRCYSVAEFNSREKMKSNVQIWNANEARGRDRRFGRRGTTRRVSDTSLNPQYLLHAQ